MIKRWWWTSWQYMPTWLDRLTKITPRPQESFLIGCWSLATQNHLQETLDVAKRAADTGVEFILGGHIFSSDSLKRAPEDIWNPTTYDRCLSALDALLAVSPSKRLFVDLERYDLGENPPYPGEDRFWDVTAALKPLIDFSASRGVELWVVPGDLELLHVRSLAMSRASCVLLPERIYNWPDGWTWEQGLAAHNGRLRAFRALGRHRMVPGLFASAAGKPDFWAKLEAAGINEVWLFPREPLGSDPRDNPAAFWQVAPEVQPK